MNRVFFLNRYFFPDHSSTSQIVSDLAFHLAASGWELHVVTSRQRYDDADAQLLAEEVTRGVHIHRIGTTRFGRASLPGRFLDYGSFYVAARDALIAHLHPGDTIIAMTDPPLASVVATYAAKRRGATLINWWQDIYPEVAARLGVPLIKGPAAAILASMRDRCFRDAAFNVAIGDRMSEFIAARGTPRDKIRVIANWSDDEDIVPVLHTHNPLRRELGLDGKFVIAYSGNLGRAHEFDTALRAAERLRTQPDLLFLCIGGGHQFAELSQAVTQRGLTEMFRFLPYQDRSDLRFSLGAGDVHWLSLRPELEGLIVPSKFYGIAATGRPVISVTAKDGEIARLVRQYDCGFVVEPGDGAAFADAVMTLANDPYRCVVMGAHARQMLDAHYTRRHAFERWRQLLAEVGDKSPAARSG
jgi:colanic acid biosynthesis glycosyl transferase WcaI